MAFEDRKVLKLLKAIFFGVWHYSLTDSSPHDNFSYVDKSKCVYVSAVFFYNFSKKVLPLRPSQIYFGLGKEMAITPELSTSDP